MKPFATHCKHAHSFNEYGKLAIRASTGKERQLCILCNRMRSTMNQMIGRGDIADVSFGAFMSMRKLLVEASVAKHSLFKEPSPSPW